MRCLGWWIEIVMVVLDMGRDVRVRNSHFIFLFFQEHFELSLISCIMSQIGHWRILYVSQHQRHMDLVLDKLIWCWFGRWMSEMISYLLSLISRSNRPMDWVIHLFQDPRIGGHFIYCFEKKTTHLPSLVFQNWKREKRLMIDIWD